MKMIDIWFMLTFAAAVIIGIMSLLWVIWGASTITDKLIRRLFRYIAALILSLMMISLMFVVWVAQYTDMNRINGSIGTTAAYAFVLAICGLMFGSALAVKKISDMYGFKARGLKAAPAGSVAPKAARAKAKKN